MSAIFDPSLPHLLTGQAFEDIRSPHENNLYVDKTAFIPKILATGSPLFVRPRRFGKSTMLSAIYSLLTGNREVFKGLAVENMWDWTQTYPVFRFDFASLPASAHDRDQAALDQGISASLKSKALVHHQIEVPISDENIPTILEYILVKIKGTFQEKTGSNNKVIILLDEYDYLLQPYILNPEKQGFSIVEKALKAFFETIKYLNGAGVVKSLVSTGICKFGGLKLFSSLNFINDVSGDSDLAAMCGYTRDEILHYFAPFIDSAVKNTNRISVDDLMEELARLYNGYAFSLTNMNCKVFNPFSILHFFRAEEFGLFWFSTSIHALTHPNYHQHIEDLLIGKYAPVVDEKMLSPAEVSRYTIDKMLFFTGYLTLRPHPTEQGKTTLDWPNAEVSSRFSIWYAQIQTQLDMETLQNASTPLRNALLKLKVDDFCLELQVILRSLNHQFFEKKLACESHFHLITDLVLKMSSMDFTLSELVQAQGRIDLVSYVGRYCYIFELKIIDDESPENINKKIQEIKTQVASKQYSHGVAGLTNRSRTFQQCVIGLIFAKSRNLVAYTIISSPNKELLPENNLMDIVERAQTRAQAVAKYILPEQRREEEGECFIGNEANRWPDQMRQMQELYEKMLKAVQEKAAADLEREAARLKAEADAATALAKAEADAVRLKAELDAVRLKAEAARLKAEADAVGLKAKADAETARLKAETKMEIISREEQALKKTIRSIRKLEKQNHTPHEICDILGLTPEEWLDITGEELEEKN